MYGSYLHQVLFTGIHSPLQLLQKLTLRLSLGHRLINFGLGELSRRGSKCHRPVYGYAGIDVLRFNLCVCLDSGMDSFGSDNAPY